MSLPPPAQHYPKEHIMPEISPDTVAHIFVSHLAADANETQAFYKVLQAQLPAQTKLMPLSNSPFPAEEELREVDIFVAILSPDYTNFALNPFNHQQFAQLFKRADRRRTLFCPVLLRPCAWGDSIFKRFRMLPIPAMHESLHPVTDSHWGGRDNAWKKVLEDLNVYISFVLEYKPTLLANQPQHADEQDVSAMSETQTETSRQLSLLLPSEAHFAYRSKPSSFPIKVGFVASDMQNAEEAYWLKSVEWQELSALAGDGSRLQIVPLPSLKHCSLFEFLLLERIHILHFSGWGNKNMVLLPPDIRMEGSTEAVLNKTLRFFSNQLDAVVLSGCHHTTTVQAVKDWVSNIVGTYSITPAAMGIPFSRQFYNTLLQNDTYANAFGAARSLVDTRYLPKDRLPALVQHF